MTQETQWRNVIEHGYPKCDGETVFVGINASGHCACFNEHGLMSLKSGQVSVCFYESTEGSAEVMTGLAAWCVLPLPLNNPTTKE